MFRRTHVKAQHGILRPLLLYLIYIESLEEFPAAFEVSLEGRDKQRLAEPPGAAQEDVVADLHHLPDVFRLVDVQAILLHQL